MRLPEGDIYETLASVGRRAKRLSAGELAGFPRLLALDAVRLEMTEGAFKDDYARVAQRLLERAIAGLPSSDDREIAKAILVGDARYADKTVEQRLIPLAERGITPNFFKHHRARVLRLLAEYVRSEGDRLRQGDFTICDTCRAALAEHIRGLAHIYGRVVLLESLSIDTHFAPEGYRAMRTSEPDREIGFSGARLRCDIALETLYLLVETMRELRELGSHLGGQSGDADTWDTYSNRVLLMFNIERYFPRDLSWGPLLDVCYALSGDTTEPTLDQFLRRLNEHPVAMQSFLVFYEWIRYRASFQCEFLTTDYFVKRAEGLLGVLRIDPGGNVALNLLTADTRDHTNRLYLGGRWGLSHSDRVMTGRPDSLWAAVTEPLFRQQYENSKRQKGNNMLE